MSLNESSSRKRVRLDDEPDGDRDDTTTPNQSMSSASTIQRDKDVWFSDGNIVIIAAKEVAFRVYKGTLAQRSEIFSGMFSALNPDAAVTKTFDGCPVVEIEDAPKDIRHLLLVICCGKNYYYQQDAVLPVPVKVLASLVRMAHKYFIQDVLDDALSRLKKYYTANLAAWQDPDARARYVSAKDADAPTVIQLARLTDTPSLLPTAFLACTELMTEYRVNSDGSFRYPAASLSVPDQVRAIVAKGHLAQACATRALVLLSAVPSEGCTKRAYCATAREAPLDALREDVDAELAPITDDNALLPIAEKLWRRVHWRLFCQNCRKTLRETDAREVHGLWKQLPSQFDLKIDDDCWPAPGGGDGTLPAGQPGA